MRDKTILCIAPRTWNSLWRESQQIMSRMSKQNRVLYIEPGTDVHQSFFKAAWHGYKNFFKLKTRPLHENLILLSSPPAFPIGRSYLPRSVLLRTLPIITGVNATIKKWYVQRVIKQLKVQDPIVWVYSPHYFSLVGKFREKLICYHNYDEFSQFVHNHHVKDLIDEHDSRLTSSVDIVFTTSRLQAERRRVHNPATYFLPNGVDFDLFNRALDPDCQIPDEIARLPRPIIGFIGWLGHHIDMALLVELMQTYSDYSLVLIGPDDLPKTAEYHQLHRLKNVHFLGRKDLQDLPRYLKAFDVALMPYSIDGHMASAYPLKLHEYLAAGKAIVAVNMSELHAFDDVIRITETTEDFIQQVEEAIKDNSPKSIQARTAVAKENTWDARVQRMYEIIDQHLSTSNSNGKDNNPFMKTSKNGSVDDKEFNPLVSIVIVTWNRRDDILTTVQSIYDQQYPSFEIVVVDNASSDDTIEALEKTFPEVKIIALEKNLGAAGGRNPGIASAMGEIIFILDSDASIGMETITNVVEKFRTRPDVGAIACKIVNAYTKEMEGAGWSFSERDRADQDTEFLSFSFSEGACAFRKKTLERSGLFSDSLFFGREGEELSLRIWDSGDKILYYPDALVFHRVSPEQRVKGGNREYYDVRNSLQIYLTKYPWWMLLFFLPMKISASLIRGARRGQLRDTFRGLRDLSLSIPTLIKQRKPIKNNTARTYIQLLREHGPLRWTIATWLKYKT